MKRIYSLIVVFALVHAVQAQERKLTLQQCIDSALTRNINVRRSALITEAADVNHRQSRANLLPNLNANITHGINKGRSIDPFTNTFVNQSVNFANYGLGTNVVLFNGFNMRHTIRQMAYAHDAAKLEWQQAKDELTLNVIIAYLQVLNNEDLVAVARQQVEAARKQVERLEILNRQGAITPSQLYELSGQMKENELAVINSQNAVESAKLALLQLMNQPYDTNIRLERVDAASMLQAPAETASAVYAKALDQLAAIRAADQRQKSADAALKAARGAMYPTLLFSGNLNTNYSSIATRDILLNTTEVPTSNYVVVNGSQLPVFAKRDQYALERIRYGNQLESNLFSNIGLTLRLPLFNSFQSRNRIRLAQIDYKSAQLIGESVRVEVRQQVEQAHLNAVNAWNRYNVLTQQVDFFKEAFRIAEVRFNAGVGNSIDYVLAKTNYDRANLNLVMAKYDYLFRRQVLSFYTGEK